MQNYQSITLDVNNCIEYKYINAKQGDINSRFLRITLTENGKKIVPTSRCTASFRCLKPDGRICVNKSTINSDGTITVKLTEQVLASAGTVRADISLLDGSTVLSSATFFIIVEGSPAAEGNVLSSDEFSILVETTNEAVAAINSIDDVVGGIKTAISDVEDVKAFIGFENSDILGLQVDYENKKYTRLAGAAGKTAGADFDSFNMFGGRKRCNVSNDGTINAWYGDENFVNDETNGQVMVCQPRFYYKVVPLKLDKIADGFGYHMRKANYYVSDTPKAGFKLHPAFYDENGNEVDYILFSAYEGSLHRASSNLHYDDNSSTSTNLNLAGDTICSVSGKKPISSQNLSITRKDFETMCSNRGKGWYCDTIKTYSANQLLMMIELGTMNVQNAVGLGVVDFDRTSYNASSITGSTKNLGNETGNASSTANSGNGDTVNHTEVGKVAVSYRGIENPWGNIWKWLSGINIWGNGEMAGGQAYICNNLKFEESKRNGNYEPVGFTLPYSSGYISAVGYGNEKYDWLFLGSEFKGTSNLPIGDANYYSANLNGYRALRAGGCFYLGSHAGAFCTAGDSVTTFLSVYQGCRIVYIPTAE